MEIIIPIVWVVSGVIAYAGTLAYFRSINDGEFRVDLSMAIFAGLLGPIGLCSSLVATGFYCAGFKLWK